MSTAVLQTPKGDIPQAPFRLVTLAVAQQLRDEVNGAQVALANSPDPTNEQYLYTDVAGEPMERIYEVRDSAGRMIAEVGDLVRLKAQGAGHWDLSFPLDPQWVLDGLMSGKPDPSIIGGATSNQNSGPLGKILGKQTMSYGEDIIYRTLIANGLAPLS